MLQTQIHEEGSEAMADGLGTKDRVFPRLLLEGIIASSEVSVCEGLAEPKVVSNI